MERYLTLTTDYRGFEKDTQFECIAEYGSWHPARAKLETKDSTSRIEVTDSELDQYFVA